MTNETTHFLRKFHGFSPLFWLPFTDMALVLGWLHGVTFVNPVSTGCAVPG